jgi:tripartite-type tricarboxylate transporter receptor subunit TctC
MRHAAGSIVACAVLAATLANAPASAEQPFYKDKTIRIIISTGVAGGYMEYARTLSEHMGAHIAGHPGFIVQSMPGAGGLLATNHLYKIAPHDGTVMGIVHSTVPLAPLWGNKGARFDALKFNWIGAFDRAPGLCVIWAKSPIKTWHDILTHEVTVGSSGAGSQMEAYPRLLNRLFGAKFKIVGGYKDGTDIYLAMERGEVEGRCGGQLAVIKSTRPEWLTQHKVRVPIVISDKRMKEFPDAPSIMEFVTDKAMRQQLELITTSQSIDRPVLMPPGVPKERVQVIRAAFDETMKDPAFRAAIEKRHLTLDPVSGAEMTAILEKAYSAPPAVIDAARKTMASQ